MKLKIDKNGIIRPMWIRLVDITDDMVVIRLSVDGNCRIDDVANILSKEYGADKKYAKEVIVNKFKSLIDDTNNAITVSNTSLSIYIDRHALNDNSIKDIIKDVTNKMSKIVKDIIIEIYNEPIEDWVERAMVLNKDFRFVSMR